MKNRIFQYILALCILAISGCETIATKDDIGNVQSKVSDVQDDFYATSMAISERFQAIETNTDERFSSVEKDIRELSEKADRLSSDTGSLSEQKALLSTGLSSINSEIRKVYGKIDELDYKFGEEIKKAEISSQQKDFEVRRDIEGLKKTYNDIISSISALSKNLSAIQNDMMSINKSQQVITDSVNKVAADVERNAAQNASIEKAFKKNTDIFLNELTRQESEIFVLKKKIEGLEKIASSGALTSGTGELLEISSGKKYYTVKKGDYLGKIAGNYKTSVRAIKAANNLKRDTIYIGQKLVIP